MNQRAQRPDDIFYDRTIAERIESAMEQCHFQRSDRDRQFHRRNMAIEKSDFTGLFKLGTPLDVVTEIKALSKHFESCSNSSPEYVELYNNISTIVFVTESFNRNGLLDEHQIGLTYGLIDFVLSIALGNETLYVCRRMYQKYASNNFAIAQMLMQLYLQGNIGTDGEAVSLPDWLVKNLTVTVTEMAKCNNLTYVDAKVIIEYFNSIIEK